MISKIKELRDLTGVGVLACKEALEKSEWDLEDAVLWLRKHGGIKKRSGKKTMEGTVGYYNHTGGKICTMVELNCETDFVARSKEFQDFAHELAMHIAAAHPQWISRDDVPGSVIDIEIDIIKTKIKNKPPNILEKIVQGKLNKFFQDTCLLEQMYVKDTSLSIQDKFNELGNQIKENVVIRRFARFEVGS